MSIERNAGEHVRALGAAAVLSCIAGCHRPGAPRAEALRESAALDASALASSDGGPSAEPVGSPPSATHENENENAPAAFDCLADHYAGRASREPSGAKSTWSLRLPDGTNIPYDDGRPKRTADRIASPDVEDVFALPYPIGAIVPVTDEEQDPGRVRLEPLFRATYGTNEREVSSALVPVRFTGKTVRFHRRAAPALERVATRIEVLLHGDPTLGRWFKELGGTFATRAIAGTDRTSAHAWGIAIDIDTSMSDYWRNAPKSSWRNRIPQVIVDAFESEGFVWGGRWFHYDTMHFEYRPELFDRRCRSGG